MTTYSLVYRTTVYAPRSQDPTETTVLTPIAGAPHSDTFIVSTKQGVGTKPYMDLPAGRSGGIDFLTRKTTVGAFSVRIADIRTTAGGSNAQRWVTAFTGDTLGRSRLIGCKITIEESTDGGSTWSPYFTGRIRAVSLEDPLWVILDCKDTTDDLARQIFTGAPHLSVAAGVSGASGINGYAFMGAIMPVGLPAQYGNFTSFARLNGTIGAQNVNVANGDGTVVSTGQILLSSTQDKWAAVVTDTYFRLAQQRTPRVIWMVVGGKLGCFNFYDNDIIQDVPFEDKQYRRTFSLIMSRPGDPFFMDVPSVATSVEFWVSVDTAPSKDVPLYLADVHPVQLWADILDGKFSLSTGSGVARPLATRDSSPSGPWAPLIADQSFNAMMGGPFRDIITEPAKANDWIEKYICQPYNLAYYIDGSGNVVPKDLRRKATIVPALSITDEDLRTDAKIGQTASRDNAVTAGQITLYHDASVGSNPRAVLQNSPDAYPVVPPGFITSTPASLATINATPDLRDLGDKLIKIDAQGLRIHPSEETSTSGQDRATMIQSALAQMLLDMMAPFAGSSATGTLPLRRRVSVNPGDYVSVNLSKQINPASNTRGGARLFIVTQRAVQGLNCDLSVLDCGANAVAVSPSIGTPTIASDDPNSINDAVTLSAAGDAVLVQYAVTATSTSTRPDELSALWTFGATAEVSSTVRISNLPSGMRIWVRARSQAIGGVATKLPSPWAVPSGTGYVDLAGLTAPNTLAVTNAFSNRVDLTWVNGSATLAIEVFQAVGASIPDTTGTYKIKVLDAGAIKLRVTGLTALTQYTWGVRHRDPNGGSSSIVTVTTTLGSTPGTAPRPASIDIAVRPSA